MRTLSSLHWPLVVGLGALALVRPLVSIVEDQLGVGDPPAVPVVITLVVSAVWVAAVGLGRVARPVLTLVCVGLTYAVLSILLSGVLSPVLTGQLQGPLANPVAVVPVLAVNALWGLATGGLALLLQRARSDRGAGEHARS
ncbi:hypothetical protein GC722_07535 [Auraticoccus sp. F435]|uniref:Uncharacterized protein n=1 Tax=Auraticoccus cholistanensis TaxID=2656650 RepID=A0A6A9UWB7_9ACTN|nr:hypothetical protein [Auraticoccus cholistanensis]MVA75874.1 hypothetical protein [Auraticoccus cholistanensis]